MMHFFKSSISRSAGWSIALALAGCASKEPLPNFYTLTPPGATASTRASARGPRIFIRRVTLPGYLLPTKIARRRADHQIEYSATALWAENLREGFGRALADALAQRPGIGAVTAPPLSNTPLRDFDLDLQIDRFEGNDAGEVVLAARWQLYRPDTAAPLVSRQSRFVQRGWTYGDEPAEARFLGITIEQLAAQIGATARR